MRVVQRPNMQTHARIIRGSARRYHLQRAPCLRSHALNRYRVIRQVVARAQDRRYACRCVRRRRYDVERRRRTRVARAYAEREFVYCRVYSHQLNIVKHRRRRARAAFVHQRYQHFAREPMPVRYCYAPVNHNAQHASRNPAARAAFARSYRQLRECRAVVAHRQCAAGAAEVDIARHRQIRGRIAQQCRADIGARRGVDIVQTYVCAARDIRQQRAHAEGFHNLQNKARRQCVLRLRIVLDRYRMQCVHSGGAEVVADMMQFAVCFDAQRAQSLRINRFDFRDRRRVLRREFIRRHAADGGDGADDGARLRAGGHRDYHARY